MSTTLSDIDALWQSIEQAGNVDSYVQSELEKNGFVVERQETDHMSKRETSMAGLP